MARRAHIAGGELEAGDKLEATHPPRAPLNDDRLDSLIAVLDAIRHDHAHTRPELVRRTGLGRSVVAQRTGELIERGLVEDGELSASSGGRAPRRLRFRADAGHLLVADLGATSIDVAVADLSGRVLAHACEPARISLDPDVVLGRVEQLFRELLDATPRAPGTLWGIGIGLPSPVEFGSGRPVAPPLMPGWDGYPVRERFSAGFGAPTWVDNDANVMALGERRAGVAVGHENVVFVKLGTGIGAGLITAGHIHRGAQGSAGDVGHIQVGEDVVCRCGNIGCLEALAGGAALARDGEAAARAGASSTLQELLTAAGSLDAADVAAAAARGDAVSNELISQAGRLIGEVLAILVNVFNPSLIVVGGGMAKAGDALLASIKQAVYRRSLPLATRELTIQRSALDGLGGVIGAATMVADELFARDTLGAWLADGSPVQLAVAS